MIAIAKAIGIRGGLLIAAAALALWFWIGWTNAANTRDEVQAELTSATATIELLQHDAELKELAAIRRQADNAGVADLEEELHDAIEDAVDSAPSPLRVKLACRRLRNAGHSTDDIPAICGSAG